MKEDVESTRCQADFYRQLFTGESAWAGACMNADEAARAGKIIPILSRIRLGPHTSTSGDIRALDLGCGRGWLTNLTNAIAPCEGADPVAEVIDAARRNYPGLAFHVGTAQDLATRTEMRSAYDIIICSEVIEHIPYGDQDAFFEDIKNLLVRGGHLILTTPRQELRSRYFRWRRGGQPTEDWISEKDLLALALLHGLILRGHDRAYIDIRMVSLLNAFCRSKGVERLLDRCDLAWVLAGLRYAVSIYQVWWFQEPGENSP